MRVSADSKVSQDLFSISQERIMLNQGKLPGVGSKGIVLDPGEPAPPRITLQAVNNTMQGLLQTIGLSIENFSGHELSIQNNDPEEIVAVFVESMNKVLSVTKEASMETSNHSDTVQGCLRKLQEIIIAAMKTPEALSEEVSAELSSIGFKLMYDGSLSLNHKLLKEAISANNGEAVRTIKTVMANLFETLPLCIDPNSGSLIYTGRKLEDDDRALKSITELDKELEKERTELLNKLDMAELLISHSEQFIANLKFMTEMTPVGEQGIG